MPFEVNKTAFHIDNNIPMSGRTGRKSKIDSLPFKALEIGQSFHIGETSAEDIKKLSAWCQLAHKKLDKRFSLRTVTDADPRGPGVRIWRVEDKGTDLSATVNAQKVSPSASARASEPAKPARKGKAKAAAVPAEPRSFNRRQARAAAAQPQA